MKSFFRIVKLTIPIIGALLLGVSCETESFDAEETGQLPDDVKQKLIRLGVNPNESELTTTTHPSGQEISVWQSGDILISSDRLFEYSDVPTNTTTKAFNTLNLVHTGSEGRLISVVSRGLGTKGDTALQQALDAYNALGLKVSFSLTFGAHDADIAVYRNISKMGFASSYFPYKGDPGGAIEVNNELRDHLDINFWKLIFMHELGHCIGLRHSDWRTRKSCDVSIGEAIGSEGAIHIPGTSSTGNDVESIMKTCFAPNERMNFTDSDLIALQFLYGDVCKPNSAKCDPSKPWKYYFCGSCFESPQQAMDNGCSEASTCIDGDMECSINADKCDQSKPWKYYFCGQCFESPTQAKDNGCTEAVNCSGMDEQEAFCTVNADKCDQSKPWKYYFCGNCYESAQQAVDNGCNEATECL